MKIAHLTSWLSNRGGGIPAVIAPLCKRLAESPGIEPTIFGLSESDDFRHHQDWGDVPVLARRPLDRGLIGFAPHMVGDLDLAAPSAIHAHGLWTYASIACVQWARRTGRPYLVSPHGMLEPWALNNSRWKKRLASLLFQRSQLCDAICLHALNQTELEDIRAYGLTNPVAVIPNGIETPDIIERSNAPWAAELSRDKKVLLFLGRLHPKKNISALLRAWARVIRIAEQEGWLLVIAGWDQRGHAEELQSLAEDLQVSKSVRLVGPQFGTDKTATLQRADAFVLPSLSEGLPMAVLEAWAYGLPVLMSGACNLPEGFDAGAAIKIPVQEEALASALSTFLRLETEKLSSMGQAGRQLAASRYSWERVACSMAELYRWIVQGGEPPEFVSE